MHLRVESPAARRPLSQDCTVATESRSSRCRPRLGTRYSRVITSYGGGAGAIRGRMGQNQVIGGDDGPERDRGNAGAL